MDQLPVELPGVDAQPSGEEVHLTRQTILTRQTTTERNNAGFGAQRQKEQEGFPQVGCVETEAQGHSAAETRPSSHMAAGLSTGTHQFRLRQVDLNGSSTLTGLVSADLQMQETLSLKAPAPNPAASTATLSFAVKKQAETRILLYNTLGQQVATIYEGTPQAGEEQRARVDVSGLPSGVYFLRLSANGQTRTQKLTVVR